MSFRIIQSARVLDNQICYHIKDANQLYDICAMRFKLHKMVYNHKSGLSSPFPCSNIACVCSTLQLKPSNT